jgi:hypothetical protein
MGGVHSSGTPGGGGDSMPVKTLQTVVVKIRGAIWRRGTFEAYRLRGVLQVLGPGVGGSSGPVFRGLKLRGKDSSGACAEKCSRASSWGMVLAQGSLLEG